MWAVWESSSREAAVPGILNWNGYVVSCSQARHGRCDSIGPWTVHVASGYGTDGASAWLTCESGHLTDHPLIYPEFALALIDDPGLLDRPAALDEMRWGPHWRGEWSQRETPHSDQDAPTGRVWHVRWGPGPARPAGDARWWAGQWPELWDAAGLPLDPPRWPDAGA